jgi:hypothetical protein
MGSSDAVDTNSPRKGRLRTRGLNPAGFSLALAARGATLTGEPFNRRSLVRMGLPSEPN